jgi:hypothetical protein
MERTEWDSCYSDSIILDKLATNNIFAGKVLDPTCQKEWRRESPAKKKNKTRES